MVLKHDKIALPCSLLPLPLFPSRLLSRWTSEKSKQNVLFLSISNVFFLNEENFFPVIGCAPKKSSDWLFDSRDGSNSLLHQPSGLQCFLTSHAFSPPSHLSVTWRQRRRQLAARHPTSNSCSGITNCH